MYILLIFYLFVYIYEDYKVVPGDNQQLKKQLQCSGLDRPHFFCRQRQINTVAMKT